MDNNEGSSPTKKSPWAFGLLKTMKDPKHIVKTDAKITIIKDMYPKAQFHFLVLPNTDISSLKSVSIDHVTLLKHMEQSAKDYVKLNHPNNTFKFGYHAEANMQRLHLHAISDDMNSLALKTKKHWNTFTTNIICSLQNNGKVDLPSREKCKEYMNTPLRCHKCNTEAKNMPELKKHILCHLK